MNQATNLIQWKNLTDKQKAQFDFGRPELYMSQRSCGKVEWRDYKFDQSKEEIEEVYLEHVNRLKILPDEWYWFKWDSLEKAVQGSYILVGSYHTDQQCKVLRPARPEEIPKPEQTLLERIEAAYPDTRPERLVWEPYLCLQGGQQHIEAQSMVNFAGYVYLAHPFTVKPMPITTDSNGMVFPVAVLWTK